MGVITEACIVIWIQFHYVAINFNSPHERGEQKANHPGQAHYHLSYDSRRSAVKSEESTNQSAPPNGF